ncbi:hypothetical protein GGR53DRAFT_277913 [Hypoxylon sp. FL1150]|nr:hypothetical protein GGR53DRAFT_277913 [Hypoxylon sp. FL1150]
MSSQCPKAECRYPLRGYSAHLPLELFPPRQKYLITFDLVDRRPFLLLLCKDRCRQHKLTMSAASDDTLRASALGQRRQLTISPTGTIRAATFQYSQYNRPPSDRAPYPAQDLHPDTYPRPDKELLRLQGFRTQATGEELQALAKNARLYPGHQYIRERAEFEPFYFFFHGRLQDKEALRSACFLDHVPTLKAASIRGWKSK